MLNQFWRKRLKVLKGFYKTYIRDVSEPYESHNWWDRVFYTQGIGDQQTLSPQKDPLTAAYHYASVELLILRALSNSRFSLGSASVCDLGSGSGHWIDFYLSIGASKCTGIDISRQAFDFLSQKYAGRTDVAVHHGRAKDILPELPQCDVVNAVGVMFHLVDEEEWKETIRRVSAVLRSGGLFIVGGHFGWLDKVNVQFDMQQTVNKRLRSARRWKRTLTNAGFGDKTVYRNHAYLFINDSLPENNVLIARKL